MIYMKGRIQMNEEQLKEELLRIVVKLDYYDDYTVQDAINDLNKITAD